MARGGARAARLDWQGLVELGPEDLQPLDDPFEEAATVVGLRLSLEVTRPLPESLPALRPPPRRGLPSRDALLAGTRRPAQEEGGSPTRWLGLALIGASLWAFVAMALLLGVVVLGALG